MTDQHFLRKIRQNLSDVSSRIGGTPQPRKLTRSVIKHTRFDDIDWLEWARKDKDIDAGILDLFVGNPKEGREGYDNAPELVKDTFLTFLKVKPVMQRKKDVAKDARLNGHFIQQMMALPEYERLHEQTMTDPMLATMATAAVVDALREMIKQHAEQVKDSNERKRQANGTGDKPSNTSGRTLNGIPSKNDSDEENWDDSQSEWGQGEQGESAQGDQQDDVDGESDLVDDVERAWDEAYAEKYDRDDEAALDEMLGEADLARGMNGALRDAADNLTELDELRRGIGLEDAEWKQMDPTARMKLATRLNTPQMKTLADLVGRMKRFAMGQQAQKINDSPEEYYDVEMGNDLRRVLRSEYAFLGHPATKVLFYKKYVDRELLQFKERGKENAGKGPIVCAIDNSGSMSGGPENWAKAVAEALRRICAEQDRDFWAAYFETNSHRERFDFPKGKTDIDKVFKFLSVNAGGGTEFDGILTECLARVQMQFDEEGKSKGDIIFITDGEAYLDDAWIKNFVEEKQRIGCRVFGIYISAYDSTQSSAMKLLSKFCDVVIKVKDLDIDDESTRTIFSRV